MTGEPYELWCRVTHAPDVDDCFWTLRPMSPNTGVDMVRLATFQLPNDVRRGDGVRVRHEGTPGYGAWRAVQARRTVQRQTKLRTRRR